MRFQRIVDDPVSARECGQSFQKCRRPADKPIKKRGDDRGAGDPADENNGIAGETAHACVGKDPVHKISVGQEQRKPQTAQIRKSTVADRNPHIQEDHQCQKYETGCHLHRKRDRRVAQTSEEGILIIAEHGNGIRGCIYRGNKQRPEQGQHGRVMPVQEGIDLRLKVRVPQTKREGDRRIVPPLSPEPVYLAALRIVSPEESVPDQEQHTDAQQDQGDLLLSDQGKQHVKKEVQDHDLDHKPSMAVDQADPEDLSGCLRTAVPDSVDGPFRHDQAQIDHPERDQDSRQPLLQKTLEIIRTGLEADQKPVA